MEKPIKSELVAPVADKIGPMIFEIIRKHSKNVHAIHLVGSAVMPDQRGIAKRKGPPLVHSMKKKAGICKMR